MDSPEIYEVVQLWKLVKEGKDLLERLLFADANCLGYADAKHQAYAYLKKLEEM